MKKIFGHPVTQKARTIVRRILITVAVILAVAFVTTLTVDLGPALKTRAEEAATNYMGRPMHIGRLSIRLWLGRFVVEDLIIDGLKADSAPFLAADRITVSMPWSTLFTRRVVFDAVEMTDWKMHVETFPDGTHSFPRFTSDRPRGQSSWTTTLQYVRAYRGEFSFQDHGTPWSIITRNLDVTVTRPTSEYRGQARFSNGTVDFQDYVPFRVDMDTTFRLDGGIVRFDRINLSSEGAETELGGFANVTRFPEMVFTMRSRIDNQKQKAIWFADDDFTVAGTTEFSGTYRMFRENMPDGRSRSGRELKGSFVSADAGVNQFQFPNLRGNVLWIPERLDVSDATADLYGGLARFDYRMENLGQRGVRGTAIFDAAYEDVDLTEISNLLELQGIRLAGRATGRNLLQWPLGQYAEHTGDGEITVTPPAGIETMTREMPLARIAEREIDERPFGPFSNHTPRQPVPVRGQLTYAYGPEWIDLGPSRIATERTYVELEGRTAYGERSRLAFHVSSADWQESDRVFAGALTAFGARTNAIPIGGYGTFDGVMVNSFSRPHIEGQFNGEQMRAFDVVWGSIRGSAVIENSYADVTDVIVGAGDSTMYVDGRFSLGFPRRDGGEQLNARIRVIRRPLVDLRRAFSIEDYDVDGLFSGEFHVYGDYTTPYGFGQMAIVGGVAYGESFDTATAGVRLEGEGVRLDSIQIVKGNGRAAGAAYVGLEGGTYSFNLDGTRIPVETLALVTSDTAPPLSGTLDFTAGGSGTFDQPRYDVRASIRDLFVGDEGIGQVSGTLNISGEMMNVALEAASPRLAVSGRGRVDLTDDMNADLSFSVSDTSLDPYVRAFNPTLSPFTTAVASGSIRVVGSLTNIDALLVDTTVETLDLRLFDYRVRNTQPIRIALDRHTARILNMRLVGEDTQLDITGAVNLHDERIMVQATGDAGLGILQGFVPDIRSSGRASLRATFDGPMRDPVVTGTMTIENGRIRHFGLPHALENISGPVRFDTRSIQLDELTAQLGQGPVQFGGRIDIESYQPTRVDVTMTGQNMRLRFPEGMRSVVDADLAVQGPVDALTLSGLVTVRNAVYSQQFDTDVLNFGGSGPVLVDTGLLEPTLPLRYDVQIAAPSTLQIRNRTVDVSASADLQLRGTYDRPVLFGRADIDRGEFTFEGRRYQITRGTIDFNNPARIQPFFDVETETRVRVPGQTYRVTARAAGTLDRLTPQFESDPPLSEIQVLSLLFGDIAPGQDVEFRQFATDITPQQQLLRDVATRALTGTVTSEIGRAVEQTLGVDTFQLTPSVFDPNTSSRLEPTARLTIGEAISDRLYLTYSRSLSASARDQIILLEFDQSDRLSWILSRNEDGTYALDLRVRRTF